MNFKLKLEAILKAMGLQEKMKTKLSATEWEKVEQRYNKKYGSDLYKDSEASESAETAKTKKTQERIMALLKSTDKKKDEEGDETTAEGEGTGDEDDDKDDETTAEDEGTGDEDDEEKKGNKAILRGVKKVVAENKRLKNQVKKMAYETQPDRPLDVVRPTGLSRKHTATHLYGIAFSAFALKHRWNAIAKNGFAPQANATKKEFNSFQEQVEAYGECVAARMSVLQKVGALNIKALTTEYDNLLDAGLGDQYLVRRQDALIARILELPKVFDVFPLRSNVQDQDLITNAFFGEFSQSYQSGEISKGGVILEPEKAKVHDIMFKTLFESMKWIETQYIGYLNQNGSDPVKWSMIEWMVLNIATVLNNEQGQRYIMGYRVEPIKGENAHFLYSSTGVIHRLLSYVEEYKVLPFYNTEFASYTQTTMYDVVDSFVDEVNQILPNLLGKALYLNQKHKKWFTDSYRERFGLHSDFSGTQLKLEGYDLPIIWVPNMGNLQLMWITEEKNVQTLENLPGEMLAIYFERRLESVWGVSVWKEGSAAAYSGRKFDTLLELIANNYADQAIFMNMPFTEAIADATVIDVKSNILFKTDSNTQATALTDLINAKEGEVYKIEIGGVTNPTSIAKRDKFINIKSAWGPTTKGAWIKLYLKGGLFYEADRSK